MSTPAPIALVLEDERNEPHYERVFEAVRGV